MAIGGGIETKGKTKGKQVGGSGSKAADSGLMFGSGKTKTVTNESLKTNGRNMAKAKNQKGGK